MTHALGHGTIRAAVLVPYDEFVRAMTLRHEAEAAADALDQLLWVLRKGVRTATMSTRRHPAGVELCLAIDGELFWSRAYGPRQLEDLNVEAAAKHNAFVAKGWVPVQSDAS